MIWIILGILWYLIGIFSILIFVVIDSKIIRGADIKAALAIGLLGPLCLFIVIWAFLEEIDDKIILDFRKEEIQLEKFSQYSNDR